jgi:hypothetical protein
MDDVRAAIPLRLVRRESMPVLIHRLRAGVSAIVLLAVAGPAALALAPQNAVPGANAPAANLTETAIQGLRPALGQVGSAFADLRINRWKGPADIRGTAQDDVASIQKDLTTTLPPLLDQAQASGQPTGPLAPGLALFRNIDALYDVVLRVSETANMMAPSDEASEIEAARAALESARGDLGNALITSAAAQDTQLAHFRAEAAAAARQKPAPPPSTIVINDGPAPAASTAKHKKKKPAPQSSPQQ